MNFQQQFKKNISFLPVPRVLTHCAEFIETAGMIDGIYRLSGIASNIQKLRVAFDEDRVPNLYQDKGVIQVSLTRHIFITSLWLNKQG